MKISLVGFMGSGKTTVGKLLAESLTTSFIDTDNLIVETVQEKIAEIFRRKGERYFRQLESTVVKETSLYDNCVIATGGGTLLDEENIDNLKINQGKMIFLSATFDTIMKRLADDDERPLFTNIDEAKKLYETRYQMYKTNADMHIETDDLSPEEVVEEILRRLQPTDVK